MAKAVLSPDADEDLIKVFLNMNEENPKAALAFRDTVASALVQLGKNPWIGQKRSDLTNLDLRFLLLRGFPYFLIYDANVTPPRVLYILHTSRDISELLS